MTNRIDVTTDDPSSTCNPGMQADHLMIHSRSYGKGGVEKMYEYMKDSLRKMKLQRRLSKAVQDNPDCEEVSGRDYESIRDALVEARRKVANKTMVDDYAWYMNPETRQVMMDLYQFFSRYNALEKKNMQLHGSPVITSNDIPAEDVYFIEKGSVDTSDISSLYKPIAVVRDATAGYREDVDMDVGGQLTMWVLNA